MPMSDHDPVEEAWVEAHGSLVERAYVRFMETGEWPGVEALQRDLDRSGASGLDVRAAVRTMPRLEGEMRPLFPSAVAIPMRLLRFVPGAEAVLSVGFAIVKRAVSLYHSEDDPPIVRSDDAELLEAAHGDLTLLVRAAQLVSDNWPDPLAGGSRGNTEWQYEVDGAVARRLAGIETINDYFDMQAEIAAESKRQHPVPGAASPEVTSVTPRDIFVLMPFGESWSDGVYGMIRRAAESLVSEWVVRVYRADDIAEPGMITNQIEAAIESADVVIADITGLNANVMYELGYAKACNKRLVILNQQVSKSPFDVMGLRQVAYMRTPTDADEHNLGRHIDAAVRAGSAP